MISRSISPPGRLQAPQPLAPQVYRHRSPQPPAYSEQRSQLRQQSMMRPLPSSMSGGPSISFGFTPSTMNMKSNMIVVPNGSGNDYYQGEVNGRGEFHGLGRYLYTASRHQYQGQFENGLPHGKGILFKNISNILPTSPNQSKSTDLFTVYSGQWRSGMKHGSGKYFYNTETHFYDGQWMNDQRHGLGTYQNQGIRCTGKWEQGRLEGKGELYNLNTNTRYYGNFQNNQFVNGTITYPNKHQYSGRVRNGLRDDNQGRYHYNQPGDKTNQVKYLGSWKNDQKHDPSGLGIPYPQYPQQPCHIQTVTQ